MTTIQKKMLYTPQQNEALEALTQATGETYADLVRRLVKDEAIRLGVAWPDNMARVEDTIRKAQSKRWPKDD